MTDVPHFTLPFRFDPSGAGMTAVVAEQDTTDEIMSCVLAVLLCPEGFRAESPAFGIEDPTFTEGVADRDAIAAALAEWEPRAHSIVTARVDALDALLDYVLVALDVPSGD